MFAIRKKNITSKNDVEFTFALIHRLKFFIFYFLLFSIYKLKPPIEAPLEAPVKASVEASVKAPVEAFRP